MKTIKTKLVHLTIAALIAGSAVSCKKSANEPDVPLDDHLMKSADKYALVVDKRQPGDTAFELEGIRREGNSLLISVNGGCRAEDFDVIWDGVILFSSPGQVNLVLTNDAKESCDLSHHFVVSVNLSKILGAQDPKNFIINVANGSKKQDASLQANGTVTFK